MYTQFFNLKQSPFSIAPDPRYLFMSERHREALAHLLYGVGSGGGIVLLTGEVGAGKTTVCRCFIEQIAANCKLAYIFNPKLSVPELLASICDEFGIEMVAPSSGSISVKRYVDAINAYLLRSHAKGNNNVLVIDEAQNLSAEVLEQLRLLTNLETNERKLLQIILIGQPELRTMLARPELEQLAQRVIARYHLGPLAQDETGSYIAHRLAVAGAAGTPFPRRLLHYIHTLSKGVPRRINLLCDRALLGAYVENEHEVTRKILRRAAAEVFAGQRLPSGALSRWAPVLLGVVAGLLIAGAVAWHWLPHGTPLATGTVARSGIVAAPVSAPAARVAGPLAPQASGPAAVAPPPAMAPAPVSGETALRELGALWGMALTDGEPCEVAAKWNLRCYRGNGGLSELRLLDRPAVLALRDLPSYAVLTSLNDAGATLRIAGKDQRLTLAALEARFTGQFVTYWRAPRGWRERVALGDRGADVDWLAKGLTQMRGLNPPRKNQPFDAKLQHLLSEFQQSQNLLADGVAGPQTFIRLIRLRGFKEPRLLNAVRADDAGAGK